ncbi:MAG: O-antigen ligase family protein [Phycisphaerae bacterium]|nr:O-antigen ligase family protein [Phycisphaerae bacterium]
MTHAMSAPSSDARQTESTTDTRSTKSGVSTPERIAFFLVLLVVGVRPLVSETYDSAIPAIVQVLNLPAGPGPVFTLTLGSLLLLAAVLTAFGRCWCQSGARYRPTGLAAGMVLLTMGMLISLFVASNRRVALTASSDWLIALSMCVLLVQLLRRPWQVRLTLCILLASAATFAIQCVMQRVVEFPETIASYEASKPEFWEAQGVGPDEPLVRLYERRLYGQEATGFFPLSNVAGSYLMLSAWLAAALAIGKLSRRNPEDDEARRFRVVFGLIAAALAVALFGCVLLTGSKGALLAGGLTAAVGLPWLWATRRLAWKSRLVLGWIMILGVAGAVVLYARQAPPASSMGFRWDYWRTTTNLLKDYFWTGVGAENFGTFYLQYKPITSPEEIRDPHNVFLTGFAQWGIFGAAAMGALVVGAGRRLAQPIKASTQPTNDAGLHKGTIGRAVALALGIFAIRTWTLLGLQPSYIVFATAVPMIAWLLTFATATVESNQFNRWSDVRIPPLAGNLVVLGVLAFLLHGMIDVAAFYPATATTWLAALAVGLAVRAQNVATTEQNNSSTGPGHRTAQLALLPLMALWAGHLALLWWAPAAAQRHLIPARNLAARNAEMASARSAILDHYRVAAVADPLDPTAPAEAAEWVMKTTVLATQPPEGPVIRKLLGEAKVLSHLATQRDPRNSSVFHTYAAVCASRAHVLGNEVDAQAAGGAARVALALYPNSPNSHLLLADTLSGWALLESGKGKQLLLTEAIEEYRQALALDAARPAEEELRRWSPQTRRRIEAEIDTLTAVLSPTEETAPTAPDA